MLWQYVCMRHGASTISASDSEAMILSNID
jgi:hypothetical protein